MAAAFLEVWRIRDRAIHERIHPRDLMGLFCIVLGLVAIGGRPLTG